MAVPVGAVLLGWGAFAGTHMYMSHPENRKYYVAKWGERTIHTLPLFFFFFLHYSYSISTIAIQIGVLPLLFPRKLQCKYPLISLFQRNSWEYTVACLSPR
jgi:hypothetical protein